MKDWDVWFGGMGSALVDGGNLFTGNAKSIASDGKVSDGAGGTMASGYSIIKADSLNAAVEIAKRCPVLKGGDKITVYETFKVMLGELHRSKRKWQMAYKPLLKCTGCWLKPRTSTARQSVRHSSRQSGDAGARLLLVNHQPPSGTRA